MSNKRIWFITGAGRGMGVDFAKAALAAGHAVVASGRDTNRVSRALGPSNDLPVMRKQRSGRIISISSSAGFPGFEFGTAYAASKFGLEGWMESLHAEVAVRHHHHHRQPGVLPHGASHRAIDELRRGVHRGLRRAQSEAARVLESPEWPAIGRPGEARPTAGHHCEPGAATAPLYRRRRCHRPCGAGGSPISRRRPASAGPLDVPRFR